MDYICLGKNIRKFRKKERLTQEALAEICDITPVFVSQIENGTRKPSLETVCSISKALSVTVDELLNADKDLTYSSEDFSVLLNNRMPAEVDFCYDILKRILENMEDGKIQMKEDL